MEITTLCYIEHEGKYLMLHRVKKKNDINVGKWIAPGGHLEKGESPDDCVKREVLEETGLTLKSARFRAIVTFCAGDITEYMCLFTSDDFEGTLKDCDEGTLDWVPMEDVSKLNLWEGDLIFLKLISDPDQPFFSLKLTYDGDKLTGAELDGESKINV